MNKRIFVRHKARSANRVFQYLCALALQKKVPGATVHGYDLDIFGVRDMQPFPPSGARHVVVDTGHDVRLDRLAYLMKADLLDAVTLCVYGQRMEYLPAPEAVRRMLGLDAPVAVAERLAIHIRAEDVFTAPHEDYPPLPFAFYARMIAASRLPPVFFGQLDTPAHVERLRARFPDAQFCPPSTPLADFRFLTESAEVVLSVSTFAWLAAWISPVTRRINLPVSGIFNPAQRPDIDLLQPGDPRYAFFGCPAVRWTAAAPQIAALMDDVEIPPLDAAAIAAIKLLALQSGALLPGLTL